MNEDWHNIVGTLLDMIDPDGVCEHGCSCGECDNCIDLYEIETIYHSYQEKKE